MLGGKQKSSVGYFDMCMFSPIFSIDSYYYSANYLHFMDKRYLILFKLYFQSKKEARKQKEAGDMNESSGTKERRKRLNSEATRRVGSSTR